MKTAVFIDMDKVENVTLDILTEKLNNLGPEFHVTDAEREIASEKIKHSLNKDSDFLEDLIEKLLIQHFEKNATLVLSQISQLFGGNNND